MILLDGSFEIRRSPVEVGSDYPIIYKVLAPSQVVQDFFHQQYFFRRSGQINVFIIDD